MISTVCIRGIAIALEIDSTSIAFERRKKTYCSPKSSKGGIKRMAAAAVVDDDAVVEAVKGDDDVQLLVVDTPLVFFECEDFSGGICLIGL
jgi:hypothetical protein